MNEKIKNILADLNEAECYELFEALLKSLDNYRLLEALKEALDEDSRVEIGEALIEK